MYNKVLTYNNEALRSKKTKMKTDNRMSIVGS